MLPNPKTHVKRLDLSPAYSKVKMWSLTFFETGSIRVRPESHNQRRLEMGSPNNQQDAPGVVFQDSESMLAFVLGKLTVPHSALTPEEQLKVIEAVTELCKPYLKYLSGFVQLGEFLVSRFDPDGVMQPGDVSRILSEVKFKGCSIYLNTFCMSVWGSFGACGKESRILLTRGGDWVFLNLDGKFHHGFINGRSKSARWMFDFKEISLTMMTPTKWKEILQGTRILPILSLLWQTCQQTVTDREQRIATIKWLGNELLAIMHRIKS